MTYSQKEKMEALGLWFALFGTMSMEGFVGELGHPSGTCMRRWIRDGPRHNPNKPQYRSKPVLTKLQALRPIVVALRLLPRSPRHRKPVGPVFTLRLVFVRFPLQILP